MIKTKQLFIPAIFLMLLMLTQTSCKKESADPKSDPAVLKTIQFSLYTDKDFSDDNNNITFTVVIQNLQSQVLWDSALATMKVKDIPDLTNKLIIQKTIAEPGNQILKVGFRYSIENVGYSWFYDTCNAGEIFKEVDYNFQ